MSCNRRSFITTFAAGMGGVLAAGCSETPDPQRYNRADIELLELQRQHELNNSGQGPFGKHTYKGYRGLAELPWFELASDGRLLLSDDSVPSAIDTHCHLGMSVLFEPKINLQSTTKRTRHLLDCDSPNSPCDLDLDKYVNANFSADALDELESTVRSQGLWGNPIVRTQTIPNLIAEMDDMRVSTAAILPIKLGLWFGDDLTDTWRSTVAQSAHRDRLRVGFSVHPRQSRKIEELEKYASQSGNVSDVKILKLHPTVQRFYPDDESMMPFYAEAERLGVTIFFHGGRAGIEPETSQRYAMPRHYEAVFANFPKLNIIVGHAGARDNRAMLKLASQYDNVWLDIHGQSLTRLHEMIRTLGGERLVFGSDWPFYHLGVSLAKVLIATQNETHSIREALLRKNAENLLGFE